MASPSKGSNGVVEQFTLTVLQPPVITCDSSAGFQASQQTPAPIDTTGYPAPATAVRGTLPPGGTLIASAAGLPTGTADVRRE